MSSDTKHQPNRLWWALLIGSGLVNAYYMFEPLVSSDFVQASRAQCQLKAQDGGARWGPPFGELLCSLRIFVDKLFSDPLGESLLDQLLFLAVTLVFFVAVEGGRKQYSDGGSLTSKHMVTWTGAICLVLSVLGGGPTLLTVFMPALYWASEKTATSSNHQVSHGRVGVIALYLLLVVIVPAFIRPFFHPLSGGYEVALAFTMFWPIAIGPVVYLFSTDSKKYDGFHARYTIIFAFVIFTLTSIVVTLRNIADVYLEHSDQFKLGLYAHVCQAWRNNVAFRVLAIDYFGLVMSVVFLILSEDGPGRRLFMFIVLSCLVSPAISVPIFLARREARISESDLQAKKR
eukprot:Colp12_sorted_trinity150504_noHs@1096